MNIRELREKLRKSWSKETCHIPLQETWTKEKPETGQCVVTVLVIQDYLGGVIAHDIKNKHYWNIINNKKIDLTQNQFPPNTIFNNDEIIKRKSLFSKNPKAKTKERYELLLKNFKKTNHKIGFLNLTRAK